MQFTFSLLQVQHGSPSVAYQPSLAQPAPTPCQPSQPVALAVLLFSLAWPAAIYCIPFSQLAQPLPQPQLVPHSSLPAFNQPLPAWYLRGVALNLTFYRLHVLVTDCSAAL